MGKYGIGARVRDKDGDEGVIVGKPCKGRREVRYDGPTPDGLICSWSKAELTPIAPAALKLEIGKSYVDRLGDHRGPLRSNTNWNASDYPFTDGERTWQADGTFCFGEAGTWDLIREATTEAPPVSPSAEKGEVAFAVGDRVTMKHEVDGNISPLVAKVVLDDGEDFHPLLIEFEDDAGFGHGPGLRQWHVGHEDLAPFRLEAGRYYRTRDGRKVGPMVDSGWRFSRQWPFTVEHHVHTDGIVKAWRFDGTISVDVGVEHPADLVAEWAVPWGRPQPKFKVGDKVDLMRDGEPVERWSNMTITSMDHDSHLYPIMTDGGLQVHEDELRLSPVKPAWTPKFKVGDVVNYVLTENAWQGTTITEVPESEGGIYHGKHPREGKGGFSEDWIVAAPPTPLPAIGTKVTLTAIVTGHNPADRKKVQVVVDGLPPGRNSIGISPAAISIAA